MVSDPSTLLLLKYGIPCHKSSDKLHLQNNLGHKLGKWSGGLHMLVLLKLLMLIEYFVLLLMLNLQLNSFFESRFYSYGFLFNCMTVGQASHSMTALTQSFNRWVGV